jgi:hypothetical protein
MRHHPPQRHIKENRRSAGRASRRSRVAAGSNALRRAGTALSVPPPLACCHRLNGLPVQRSVIHARCPGRGGRQAVSRQSATQICYTLTLEWPTLILPSRSRRHSQFLIPWRVMINEHVLKLRVRTGYQAHFRLVGVSAQSSETRRSHVTGQASLRAQKTTTSAPTGRWSS